MSAEVVKKRGRPKKVVMDSIEVEIPEVTKKSTTRAKSTKAVASKTVKAKAIPVKASPPPTPVSRPTASHMPIEKSLANPATMQKAETQPPPPSAKPSPNPVTPENSKILSKVRELSEKSEKNLRPTQEASKSSNHSPLAALSEAPSSPQAKSSSTVASKSTSSIPGKPIRTPTQSTKPPSSPIKPTSLSKQPPPPPSSNNPVSKPRIPIAAINSEIVSSISTRAGARPNTAGSKALPPNYKPTARKITLAIVAMPIAIVTSWVLYERLVLGEERKYLVIPGLSKVETTEETPPTTSNSS